LLAAVAAGIRHVCSVLLVTCGARSWPSALALCAGAGVVAQVGEGVTGWKEGDRVTAAPWTYAEVGHGTWQEYALVHTAHLVPHLRI